MPTVQSAGCPINVVIEGPENAPVLMLSNSLGTTHAMWEPQVDAFKQHFRLLRFDRRGHGGSDQAPQAAAFERCDRLLGSPPR